VINCEVQLPRLDHGYKEIPNPFDIIVAITYEQVAHWMIALLVSWRRCGIGLFQRPNGLELSGRQDYYRPETARWPGPLQRVVMRQFSP
jgi:hypothetical protein